MSKSVVIDTNLLLDDPKIIFRLGGNGDTVVIPLTVLKELDKHKFNADLAYSARSAIYGILDFKAQFPDSIKFDIDTTDVSSNDLKIIKSAERNKAVIATKDVSMSLIAEAMDVEADLYNVVQDRIHDPFVHIPYEYLSDVAFDFNNVYEGEEYIKFVLAVIQLNDSFDKNDWCFVIFGTQLSDKKIVYANNPETNTIERIDNLRRYLRIEIDKDCFIKAKDIYQTCALYALQNASHTILTGKWGSGKTLLATAYALAASRERKVFITRPPIGIDRKYDIGALPGTKNDKMIEWFSGILSALYYIYSNTRGQYSEDVDFDFIKDEVFFNKFEVIPINAIQGLSLLEKDILIVDESQLVSVEYFSMILSRASTGSKIILMGDYKQTYSVVRPSESGILKLCRLLPHKAMAHVDLKNSFRGDIIELADMLSDNTRIN